jgi:hypothetical protein
MPERMPCSHVVTVSAMAPAKDAAINASRNAGIGRWRSW